MKFSLKKAEDKAWHPNFRCVESLPDIKLVRTEFILNFVAGILILAFGGYFLINNITVQDFEADIATIKEDIRVKSADNVEAVALNREFKKDASLLRALRQQFTPYINPVDFLVAFSSNPNDRIVFSEVNFYEKEETVARKKGKSKVPNKYLLLTVKGSIQGSYNESLDAMNDYMDEVSQFPSLGESIKDIEMVSLKRDPGLEIFTYQIDITLQPPAMQCTLDQS